MLVEFLATFHVLPEPAMPWPLFLAALSRGGQFAARAELIQFDAVCAAIGVSLPGAESDAGERVRSVLQKAAFPGSKISATAGPDFIENVFASGAGGGFDA